MKLTASEITEDLELVRRLSPLVHNITNYVVMNSSANALLAVGASPVMAHAAEEVEDMAAIASALVLNIGTLSPPWVAAMKKAARQAGSDHAHIFFMLFIKMGQEPATNDVRTSTAQLRA